jgi:hypothetical protein
LKAGTNIAYTLARLKDEFPAIYDRVVAGEISAYAGAVEAGIRKRSDALAELRRAWRRASDANASAG